ncbi:MAG: ABC transporter permease [Lewinella sp.]|nr:ABC transporter permease [Lewinella sp.]
MLKNYFKLAIKVLGRNKFFTGISLFGISFTLMILMLIASFYDTEFGKNPPLSEKDRMVFLTHLKMELVEPDTTWTVDSTQLDGEMAYDSTFTVGENTSSTSISFYGHYFLDNYMRDVDGVEAYSFFYPGSSFDLFLQNRKLTVDAIYADAGYWTVCDFLFLEGGPFTAPQVEGGTGVAVITAKTARQYFGRETGVVGETVQLGDRRYEVIGVVTGSRSANMAVAADVFLPLTTLEAPVLESEEYLGGFCAAYLVPSPADRAAVKEDLAFRAANAPVRNPEEFNRISTNPLNYAEIYASFLADQDNPQKGLSYLKLAFGVLILLFVLLPTLNLVNINLSRIMERESEIGVRKAFGAHSGTILYQLLFENIIITLVGGVIGMALALGLLYLINQSQVLPDIILRFNVRVFVYSLLISLVFGVISGLLPAWRVSRLQIANVLKSNQL